MKERIIKIMRDKSLSASSLAEILGVQASGISHILSGRNNPSLDFIIRFLTNFPEVNADWFVLGAGNAYRQNNDASSVDIVPDREDANSADNAVSTATNNENDQNTGQTADRSKTMKSFDADHPTSQNDFNTPATNQCGANKAASKIIRRVMIFYTNNTVENYDYFN